MRSRLFKPNDSFVIGALVAGLLAGCGDKFSAGGAGAAAGSNAGGNAGRTDGGDGGATTGGTSSAGAGAGGSAHGGASGSAAGGASGGMSAAGAGGKAASTCNCPAGSYCQDGTSKCRLCADFSRIEFAAPEKITALSPTQSINQRFPRAGTSGTDLFYRSGAFGTEQLFYAKSSVSGPGVPISPTTGGSATWRDSAPLLAAGVLQQNFYFDRLQIPTNNRSIMTALWAPGQITGEALALAPINGTASDFSIAIAPGAARAYWMSTRNGKTTGAELVWAGMVGGTTTAPAVVDLQVQVGSAKCPWLGGDSKTWDDDATPWVSSAGTILLFRSESLDETTCMSNGSGSFDLYAAPLSKDTGLPTAAGVPLASLNVTGSTQTDPSLSADSCTIYFASNDGTGNDELYRAARN